jgi:nucleotide-binding universal stress UspA family protein
MAGPIVVPTDFSDHSATALDWARKMSASLGAPLHCVFVARDPAVHMGTEYAYYALPPPEDVKQHVTAEMEKFVAKNSLGAGVVTAVLVGTPFVEIIRYARAQGASMIVMSTHGYSGLKHVMMGSTTEAVVRKADCPVLSVPARGVEFKMP